MSNPPKTIILIFFFSIFIGREYSDDEEICGKFFDDQHYFGCCVPAW